MDYAGRLILNDKDEPVISFGKHKSKTAREVYFSEPSYFAWIDNGDFTLDTKRQFALLKAQFEAEKRAATTLRKEALDKPIENWDSYRDQLATMNTSEKKPRKRDKKGIDEDPKLF